MFIYDIIPPDHRATQCISISNLTTIKYRLRRPITRICINNSKERLRLPCPLRVRDEASTVLYEYYALNARGYYAGVLSASVHEYRYA